jgi:hypothetical protein
MWTTVLTHVSPGHVGMRVAVCPRWITSHVNAHKAIVTHSVSNMLHPPCYRTYLSPDLLVTAISTTVILTQCEGT